MISVIILARDEAAHLPRLLARLNTMRGVEQIILADGGSRDATIEIALQAGAQVVVARGRGAQLNAGAQVATQPVLWFLHADCWPSRGCGTQLRRAVGRGAMGGHFRVRFESRSIWARAFEAIARLQSHIGWFYGDSGMWVRRETFDALNGFKNWPLFEDFDFARRLCGLGRTETLPGRLHVSARRFRKQPIRTLGLWLELQARFALGESPESLAQRYRKRA